MELIEGHNFTGSTKNPANGSGGFTLTELVVVIGIIALLLAILMPALARARQKAQQVRCMSNLRQIAMAGSAYASENGRFPQDSPGMHFGAPYFIRQWVFDALQRYGATDEMWQCPANPVLSKRMYAGGDSSWFICTWTSYLWVAEGRGLLSGPGDRETGQNYQGYTTSVPGDSYTDSASFRGKDVARRVVAADMIWMGAGPPYSWQTNHVKPGTVDPWSPRNDKIDVQLTAYGDGHVIAEKLGGDRLPAVLIGDGAGDNSVQRQTYPGFWKQPTWW